MRLTKSVIVTVLFLFNYSILFAFEDGKIGQWMVYDSDLETYVPYVTGYHYDIRVLNMFLEPDSPALKTGFEISSENEISVFCNQKLLKESTYKWSLFNLKKWFEVEDQIFVISIKSVEDFKSIPTIHFFDDQNIIPLESNSQVNLEKVDKRSFLKDYAMFFMMILALLLALRAIYIGNTSLKFEELFKKYFRNEWEAKEVSGINQVIYFLAYSLTLSLMIYIFNLYLKESPFNFFDLLYTSSQVFIFLFCQVLLSILIAFFINQKYLLSKHLAFSVFSGWVSILLIFLGSVFVLYVFPTIEWEFLGFLMIISVAVRVLLLFLSLSKEYLLQNLLLFSYFCATEIIPLLVLSKYFIFSSYS